MKDNKNDNHRSISVLGKQFGLPRTIWGRKTLGIALIIGGCLGFLPILGFWMIPLGLYVLSHDSHRVRKWRRRTFVKLMRWRAKMASKNELRNVSKGP